MKDQRRAVSRFRPNNSESSASNRAISLFSLGKGADDPAPGHVLLESARHHAELLLHPEEERADTGFVADSPGHEEGNTADRDDGEQPVDPDKHDRDADEGAQHERNRAQAHLEHNPDAVDVLRGPRHQLAGLGPVEVAEGHGLEVAVQFLADVVADVLRDGGDQEDAAEGEQALEDHETDHR